MRALLLASAMVFAATPALASPTCKDRNGDTARCGTSNAMPVGWSPPPGLVTDHESPGPPTPSEAEIVSVVVLIAAFITLIALMPDFDGRHASDWGAQEDDDERRD